MDIVELAREIATEAHSGQFRWDGKPYITHPEAVADMLSHDFEKAVALLHDVLEDTEVTPQDLLSRGIPEFIISNVQFLTKNSNINYLNYILMLRNVPVARKVKIADITHNLSTLDKNKKKDKYEKYVLAKWILENAD